MHIKDLTPFHLAEFGKPQIKKTFGLSFAHYTPGQIPGWKIAKKLHLSGLLQPATVKAVNATNPSTPEEWAKIALLEEIPAAGYTPPYITDFIDSLPRKARLSEITYDSDFTTTLYKVLESFALNTPGKSTVYPLLDGPPGASKSIVVFVAAALLGVPVYTVTGSDGAADEIKISLLGGDNACADTLFGLIKRYAYQGWIKSPLSLKALAIGLHRHGTLDAIPETTLQEIANFEKIRENITCYTPGAYQLAAMNGGILFLDEINGFKGVTTVLTEILENYTVEQHPNFFVIGALNPAGEKHDRDPLPPEIRSRTATIYVKAPSVKSYQNMLHYLFSGEQPKITLPTGKTGKVTPVMTGFSVAPRTPSLLQRSLQPDCFTQLISNIATFHKHVESKYEEGLLNPKDSAIPTTQETASVDRRMLVRGINALDTYLHLLQDPSATDLSSGLMNYDDFVALEATPSKELVAKAIERMLERVYLDAFNFTIQEEIEIEKNKKVSFGSGQDLVKYLIEFNNLSYDKLLKYLKTQQDVEKIYATWKKVLSTKHGISDEKTIRSIVETAIKDEVTPESKFYDVMKSVKPTSLVSVNYMATKSSRQDYTETFYPGLTLKDSEATPLLSILENRLKMLDKKNPGMRFATTEEYPEIRHFITQRREENPTAIFIAMFPSGSDMSIGMMVPFSCFNPDIAASLKRKQAEAGGTPQSFLSKCIKLKEGDRVNTGKKLLGALNDVFMPVNGNERLQVDHITEVIPLDILVPAK
jgi:hypothetical protein